MSFFGFKKKEVATAITKNLSDYTVDELIEELQRRGLTIEKNDAVVNVSTGSVAPPADSVAAVISPEAIVPEIVNIATDQKVFAVLESIEKWSKLDRHRNDKDRKFTQLWSAIYSFDWARSPRGYCCDANKSVKIGLGEYSKWEDAESAQVVIIQHYDSERPGNYEKRNSWGEVPPVWAIAFSCEEMRALTHTTVEKLSTEGTLIHREPEGEYDANEPWWSESHWLVENNKITGIRLAAKCTQDTAPQEQVIRFKVRGSTFELLTAETVKHTTTGTTSMVNTTTKALPQPSPAILPNTSYLTPSTTRSTTTLTTTNTTTVPVEPFLITGESPLTLRVSKGTSTTKNYDNTRDHTLCQSVTSATITVTNPTDTRIAIPEYWMEFLQPPTDNNDDTGNDTGNTTGNSTGNNGNNTGNNTGNTGDNTGFTGNDTGNTTGNDTGNVTGTWTKCPTRVGVNSTDYYGRSITTFVDSQSFAIDAHASLDIVLEGTWSKPTTTTNSTTNHFPAYNGRPHNTRIHTAFPDPLSARIVLTDDTNAVKTLQFHHTNDPLDHLWTSYEDAVTQLTESRDGFGALYRPEMWLCVENPLDLNKCIICVTTAEENPHVWFVRVQSDRRDIGGNYASAGPVHFRKIAFKAMLQEEVPTEVEVDLGSATYCKLTGLLDHETKTIYALHGVIEIEHEGKVIAKTEAYMRLDYARVTDEE